MKVVDLQYIEAGVRQLGAVKETLAHIQEAYTEAIGALAKGFGGNGGVTVLYGCVNSGTLPNYNISAGAVYYDGEIFDVPAFSGTATGENVPVLALITTYIDSDPALYRKADGSTQSLNTHKIRRLVWNFGTSGAGIADFSEVVTLKSRIENLIALSTYATTSAVTSAIAEAVSNLKGDVQTNDTLGKLEDSIGELAEAVDGALDDKVSKLGDTMSGALAMGSNKITGLASGESNQDAVNVLQLQEKLSFDLYDASTDMDNYGNSIQAVPGNAPNAPAGTTNADGFLVITMTDRRVTGSNGTFMQLAIQYKGSSGGGAGSMYVRNRASAPSFTWTEWTQIS